MAKDDVARALAFFQASDDIALLREVLAIIRPRAAAAVRNSERSGVAVPQPALIEPAAEAGTKDEALRTLRALQDFAQLQAVGRVVGRRIEELMNGPT